MLVPMSQPLTILQPFSFQGAVDSSAFLPASAMDSRPSSSLKMRTLAYMPVVEVQGYNAHNKLQVGQLDSVR